MPGTGLAERVVHAWANGRELTLKAYWTDGKHIYHYAACILAHVGDTIVLNTHYYSQITAMFQRVIREHLEANNIFFMECSCADTRKGERLSPEALFDAYEQHRMAVQYGTN